MYLTSLNNLTIKHIIVPLTTPKTAPPNKLNNTVPGIHHI